MPSVPIKDAPPQIPAGYVAVPVSADQCGALLRLCAIVKKDADPVSGHLVVLRDMLDGRVLLGCVVDAGGAVQQWVELWIQDVNGLSESLPARREALTNALLDQRWEEYVRAYESLCPSTLLRTGWELRNPPPTYIDLSQFQPVHPADASGGNWSLCRDDSLLSGRGLPPYSTSLHRYLFQPQLQEQSRFVPMTEGAPTGQMTITPAELLGGRRDLVALNASAGRMMVRSYSPLAFEPFVDLIGGGAGTGITHGRSMLNLVEGMPAEKDAGSLAGDGWLYLGKHGRSGRLLETLHLKLRALADAVGAVRRLVLESHRPVLSLSAESFQVRLAAAGSALPTLWTARVELVDPGEAVQLPIEGTDARYFVLGRATQATIYRPETAAHPVRGRCSLRIRQVLPDVGGASLLEGTITTQERIEARHSDLVWMRMMLASGPVNLYARLEKQAALAAGEYRFRTIGQRFSSETAAQVKSAVGVPISNTSFEVLPLLSTPCDLYALGVLSVRTLLVNATTPLPVALDELLSLARQVATEHDASVPLGQRIRNIFDRDQRWMASLGPQHLVHAECSAQEAMDLVPAEVWWDVLGMMIRMFPGVGPDSACADFGDAPDGGPHRVFDRAVADLDALLVRSRSLIVIDWRANREIHAVIRGYSTGLGGAASASSQK